MSSAFIINLGTQLWGKKWRIAIIFTLKDGPLRFSQLKYRFCDCSVKVLSEALQELEQIGLITRVVHNTSPVKVTYELHPDTEPLVQVAIQYHKVLVEYFYKHRDRFGIPEKVIEELKQELLSSQ